MKKVLHILCGGGIGGIEVLCKEYVLCSDLKHSILIVWHHGEISDEMKRLGMDVEVYNTAPKYYFSHFVRFLRKCKAEEYDAIICHQQSPLIVLFAIGVKFVRRGISVVAYLHSNVMDWRKKEQMWGKILCCVSDRIICISRSVRESARTSFGFEKKLKLIYNGIDLDRFVNTWPKNREEKLEIVYTGRLVKEKGVQNIIKAIDLLPNNIPYRFRILGDGLYRRDLEKLCTELSVDDKVEFLGNCQNVHEIYKRSDVFIHLPDCQEGFGITVVEAMAAGLICIGNRKGAMPEIIKSEENGFLVNTPEECAEILMDSVKHPEWFEEIRKNAVKSSQQYSIKQYTQQMDSLISHL